VPRFLIVATRRELLLGAGAGAVGLALGGCAVNPGILAGHLPGVSAHDLAVREAAGSTADPYGRPVRVGARRVIWSTTPVGRYAAITFDDGPTPEFTPRILDALAAAGVHASFNVIGYNAVRHADLTREIIAQGHEIGNHTWSHLDQTTLGAAEIRHEIVRCKDEVEQLVQRPLAGFRPPRGELTGHALLVAAELGYDVFLYSVTRGPSGTSTAATVEDYLATTVQPGDIVDLHDGLGRGTFSPAAPFARALAARREVEVQALPRALRRIADRGIHLTTATDLVARSSSAV
jgi:peptidoglycan/xylan/chitin deacetylase (PgdA/CDA1 family)